MASSFLGFSLLFLSLNAADGFMEYDLWRCAFTSPELKDIEFTFSTHFNKMELVRFSSSVGKFVGFDKYGFHTAEILNNNTAFLARYRGEKERYCKPSIDMWYSGMLTKKVPPSDVTLSSVTPPGGKHTHMLMCSVYGFYPKLISVKWLRDGKVTTSDVTSTEELADGDWYYQIHSHLEFTPRSGEKISCMVEHISLSEPVIRDWDPSLPESERNKIAIGASGLILGLILSLAGFIYYKRKMQGRILVPTN
ncbi:H-2 class II histocompatibility antigen, E-S beta chain-like isoform X2 [Myripristis murdjan]|uniref:H-2 class II histocompatibility antigen, E-S beta chain-like isoform X2 n=1 Tax=Myripristis murdjan TaxID=586833 RepID=UPI001175E05B|nr:H-2 class II histocompatibility antigen, E-S beta chain-like isoform X2 [Myripristis murdjan]XP_029932290.1 H-2 class II histocompatibility antigen, E-S beta chain-like isoform X2 [Myripristis murdjan]